MNTIMRLSRAVVVLTLVTLCGSAFAAKKEKPEKPPKGMGKYLVVLWEPGTPVPGKQDERMKRVAEPDIEKLGGRTLTKEVNRRVIFLPYAALEQLRRHEAVSHVQRVWAGEPFSEWTEPASVATSRPTISNDSDTFTWERDYAYDADGNITDIGDDQFQYDDLNRITHATVNGAGETYFYDSFGNLTGLSRQGTSGNPVPVDPSSNRLVGEVYDAAGNVTTRKDGGTYVYDSFNMMIEYALPTSTPRRILYDPNDERIGVFVGPSLQRWTIRDFEGQVLREFQSSTVDMPWSWEQDHIRGGGQLIAGETYEWGYYGGTSAFTYGGKRHYHLDHLGSVRVVTNQSGKSLAENDFYPFGAPRTKQHQEQINYTGDPHIDGMRFAGHWRAFMGTPGVESDDYLDYMHARYYDANMGRFLSVDPVLNVEKSLSNPQRWNRYAYVRNNPLRKIDPDGRDDWDTVNGAVNAFTHDMSLGTVPRLSGNADFESGQQLGDLLALTVNAAEVVGGANGTAASFILDATGVGAAVGVPAGVVSAAVTTHGAVSGTLALTHLSSSVYQMNKEVRTGQAPPEVKRVDKGKVKNEQDHVHFNDKNKSALNKDGTWKHGLTKLKNATKEWLEKHGWTLP